MRGPQKQVLTKPEEGVKRVELLDDGILVGITELQERIRLGELDTITIADTISTIASIIRQIISGDDIAGSYLDVPLTNLKKLATEMAQLGTDIWTCATPVLRGTALATSKTYPGKVIPFNASMGSDYTFVGFSNDTTTEEGQQTRVCRPGFSTTTISGLEPSREYFIQVDGSISAEHPPKNATRVQSVGIAKSATELYVVYREPLFRRMSFF